MTVQELSLITYEVDSDTYLSVDKHGNMWLRVVHWDGKDVKELIMPIKEVGDIYQE